MANKFILVPEDIYRSLNSTDTGDINLDFISRALEGVKRERENASAKNIHYNQELRRYLHLRNERENKPIKVELAGGPKIIANNNAAVAIRDDGLTKDSRGDTDDFFWDDELFADSKSQQEYYPSQKSSKYYSPSPSPSGEKFHPKYEMDNETEMDHNDLILATSAPLLDDPTTPYIPKKKYRARPKERIFQRGQKRRLAEEHSEHGIKIPFEDLLYQAMQWRAALQGRKNRKAIKLEPTLRISNQTSKPSLPEPEQNRELPAPHLRQSLTAPPQRLALISNQTSKPSLPEPERNRELPAPHLRQSLTAPAQRLALPSIIIPKRAIKRKAIDDYTNRGKTPIMDNEYRGAQQRAILDSRRKKRAINFSKTLRMPSSWQMVLANRQPAEGPIIEEPPSDDELVPFKPSSRFKPSLWEAPSRPLIKELKEKRWTKRKPIAMKFKENILPSRKKLVHKRTTLSELSKNWIIRHPSKRQIKAPHYLDIYQT